MIKWGNGAKKKWLAENFNQERALNGKTNVGKLHFEKCGGGEVQFAKLFLPIKITIGNVTLVFVNVRTSRKPTYLSWECCTSTKTWQTWTKIPSIGKNESQEKQNTHIAVGNNEFRTFRYLAVTVNGNHHMPFTYPCSVNLFVFFQREYICPIWN